MYKRGDAPAVSQHVVRHGHVLCDDHAILLVFCLVAGRARRALSIKKGQLQLVVPLAARDLRDVVALVARARLQVAVCVAGVRRVRRRLLAHEEVLEAREGGDDDGRGHFRGAPGIWGEG